MHKDLLAELTILTITFTVWKKLSAGRSVYENNVLRPVTSSSWEFTTYPANSLGERRSLCNQKENKTDSDRQALPFKMSQIHAMVPSTSNVNQPVEANPV